MDKLKELLGEELFGQVKEKIGDKKLFVAEGEEFVPQSRLTEMSNQNKELKNQLKERDNQLADLSKKATGNEDLTKQINELTEKNKSMVADYEAKILARERDYALESALRDTGARNIKALRGLLDDSKITFAEGKLSGLNEQVDAIRKSDAYLFSEVKMKSGNETPPPNPGKTEADKWAEEFSGGSAKDNIF